ncbi:hypothetical protein CEP52_009217 [Fusarium oligoseptatum]|uniref:Uncharacterized protein n=1 Tax=Fusarium oligoseptatum TaxID=2604345 RepID=A0A428TE57_9HYPO|nr:hypothetical protein CEP52_009217 [Fusarium oligoseptatum]
MMEEEKRGESKIDNCGVAVENPKLCMCVTFELVIDYLFGFETFFLKLDVGHLHIPEPRTVMASGRINCVCEMMKEDSLIDRLIVLVFFLQVLTRSQDD